MKWWSTHKGSKKETHLCENIVIYDVHEIGTIVNNRNIMQVKNKKKLLEKLYASTYWVLSKIIYFGNYYFYPVSWNDRVLLKFFVFWEAYSFIILMILMNHRTAKGNMETNWN